MGILALVVKAAAHATVQLGPWKTATSKRCSAFTLSGAYFLVKLMNLSSKAKHFPLLCFGPVQNPSLLARFSVKKKQKNQQKTCLIRSGSGIRRLHLWSADDRSAESKVSSWWRLRPADSVHNLNHRPQPVLKCLHHHSLSSPSFPSPVRSELSGMCDTDKLLGASSCIFVKTWYQEKQLTHIFMSLQKKEKETYQD